MVRNRTGDPWQDHGIGYVMFAQEAGMWDDEKIVFMMRQGSIAIYEGLKQMVIIGAGYDTRAYRTEVS
jgi:hypothetical protein